MSQSPLIYGVDFTSAPRRAKPIVIARARIESGALRLEAIEPVDDWAGFEAALRRPGPWIGGFDFPFGLPRSAVLDLGWPTRWPALVRHCQSLGRAGFRAALDAYRQTRPMGARYAHRATDGPARSHSPLKLVNPPVGLMFLEGAPRLLEAGLSVPGLHEGDPERMALEAYPGLTARAITRESYKADERARQTAARHRAREGIVAALCAGLPGLPVLKGSAARLAELVEDPSGDRLDAALAALQAGAAWAARGQGFGLPAHIDPLEGWIAGVPAPGLAPA